MKNAIRIYETATTASLKAKYVAFPSVEQPTPVVTEREEGTEVTDKVVIRFCLEHKIINPKQEPVAEARGKVVVEEGL